MTTPSLPIEPLYVVDTNALIWYLTLDGRLSQQASTVFAAAERGETRLHISAITIAEMYYADKKWRLFKDFTQTYHDLKSKPYFRLVAFVADEVLDFAKNAAVPEMHDRIITGLAQQLGSPLITSDVTITKAGLVQVVW